MHPPERIVNLTGRGCMSRAVEQPGWCGNRTPAETQARAPNGYSRLRTRFPLPRFSIKGFVESLGLD